MDRAYAGLREAAEEMNCDGLEEVINEMENYSIPETDIELWNKLKEASENYNYDMIIDIFEQKAVTGKYTSSCGK